MYMRKKDLDQYLRELSTEELKALKNKKGADPDFSDDSDIRFDNLAEPNLFEDDDFLSEWENIGIYKNQRYVAVRPHLHNYIELAYVWSGCFIQHINGKRVICREGDVCILDTQTVHSVEACGENDITINILMRKEFFDYTFLGRMTRQGILSEFLVEAVTRKRTKKNYLLFPTSGDYIVRETVENILCEYYAKDLGMREVLESYMVVLFTQLLRTYKEHTVNDEGKATFDFKVLEFLDYIEKNYQNCTLSSMAKHFGFNAGYLTTFLKEKTGRSFLEHVQEQKLNQAKLLLMNTNASVYEIIAGCGYQNISYFYKKFKENEGITPAEFRKKNNYNRS